MNCNTHNDVAAVAFCRTCGKPLCNQCTRDVRGVIYCEACLAARMDGVAPAAGFVPPRGSCNRRHAGYQQFMDQGLGPESPPGNDVWAESGGGGDSRWILSHWRGRGLYRPVRQGIDHLVIMVLLILGVSSDLPWPAITVPRNCDWLLLRLPDHRLGSQRQSDSDGRTRSRSVRLGSKSSAPERDFEGSKVPTGAAVLIGLGVIFLLHTAGLFNFAWIASGR
jgi:hypothetical protein